VAIAAEKRVNYRNRLAARRTTAPIGGKIMINGTLAGKRPNRKND
jgi:hypothetical protein